MGKEVIERGVIDKGTNADKIEPVYQREDDIDIIQRENINPDLIGPEQSEKQQRVEDQEGLKTSTAIGASHQKINYPKATFSAWYQEILRYTELENRYTTIAGDMYMHPSIGLQVFAILFQEYNIIRHGLTLSKKQREENHVDKQKEMDDLITELHYYSAALGNQIQLTEDQHKINMEVYYKYVRKLQIFKSNIHECMDHLGLSILFKSKKPWEEKLEKIKSETGMAISQLGTD